MAGLYGADYSSAESVGTYSEGGVTYTLNEEGGVCTASASWDGIASEVTVEASVSQNEKIYTVNELKAFSKNAIVTKVTIKSNDQLTLAKGTFTNNTALKTIELGEGITDLPQNFARGDKSLTAVNLNFVETIGNSAFQNCTSLSSVNLSRISVVNASVFSGCTGLTSVDLSNVTTIGGAAFGGCTGLTSVDLSNVTTIGASAFSGCTSLTSVDLPKATEIGKSAFQDCTALERVSLSQDLEIVGDTAFKSCIKLQSISLPGNILSIGTGMFQGCKGLSDVNFDPNFKTIRKSMFEGCSGLTSIDLKNVQSIDVSSFRSCTGLTSIIIPDSVKAIGNMAFEGCTSLSSCNLGSSLESLGFNVFKDCPLITGKMVIPATLVSISLHQAGVPTFPANLSEIEVAKENINFASKDGILYDKNLETVLYCPGAKTGEVTISASVGTYAFTGCHLSRITVLEGATTIGNVAFEADYQNPTLEELILPNSLESIGHNIVAGQTNLRAIILPSELGSLGSIFSGLTGLEYIVFPTTAFVTPSANAFNGVSLYYSDGTTVSANAANDSVSSLQGLRFVWDGSTAGKFYQIDDNHVLLTKVVSGVTSYGAIAKGAPFEAPEAPEAPKGLTFIGWFTDPEMTVIHNEENDVVADLTLYAKFRIDTCTVNFVVDDSVKDSISGLAPGSVVTLPTEVKDGQNFNGWMIGGTLLGAQYIVSVNDADEVGIITLEALFSPIEKSSWTLTVTGDVNGKAFWTTTNAIGTYGMITVLPDEFETATYTVSSNGGYGIISDNCAMVYSIDGNDVTVTVAFQDIGKATEYDVSVAEIASGEKHGFKAKVTAKGGYVDSDGEFAISYVYKTWNDTDKVWIYTTSGVTENVSNVTVTLPTDKKVPSVTGEFLLDNADAILVFGFATFSFKGTSVTGTAEEVIVHSPVIMCVSEIQAVVGKP